MEKQIGDPNQVVILTTDKLSKTFTHFTAVSDLNLEVRRGDVFGFLGPNGAGKTTTIRMLLGLLRPTAGHIQVFGMDNTTHLREILPRVGAIVETPVFYPYLSGVDNLRIVAAASGMKLGRANQARLDEVLEMIDLSTRGGDAYRKYSLGMKQRLAGIGKTIFLSSHVLYEIQQVCNRVAILQRGRLLKQGNVEELLSEGRRLVVRLNTLEETEQALAILQQASQDVAQLSKVSRGTDKHDLPVLYVDARDARPQEIAALLARHNLFAVEMYQSEASLEDFFLELTGTAAGEGSRASILNIADAVPPEKKR